MEGMLSFLLFAGALHVNLEDLLGRKWSILSLATLGVILSTLMVGTAIWGVVRLIGLHIPYVYALLFGALISPTDPIAVLSILRTAKPPRSLQVMITGESLFNDGVGVVVFIMIMGFLTGGPHVSISGAAELFLLEAIGGALLGFALGYLAYRLIKSVDNYTVEILLTLSLVAGGYALADAVHTSGPIAMVVAGLLIGNHGRGYGMSERTREQLDGFWELTDELLNAVLFVMIGLELLVLELRPAYLAVGLLAIPVHSRLPATGPDPRDHLHGGRLLHPRAGPDRRQAGALGGGEDLIGVYAGWLRCQYPKVGRGHWQGRVHLAHT
jgi:CPA1 family monovalent cation:H+ antiporter